MLALSENVWGRKTRRALRGFIKNFKRRWDKKPISIFINIYQPHNKSKQKTSLELAKGRSAQSAGCHSRPLSNTSMSRLQNSCRSLRLSAKKGCARAAGSPCSSREDGDLLTDSVVQLRRSSGTKPSERNRMEMTGARVRATSGCSLFFTPRQTSHGLRVHEFTTPSLSLGASPSFAWREAKLALSLWRCDSLKTN